MRNVLILIGAGLLWRWMAANRAYQQGWMAGRAEGYVHGARVAMAAHRSALLRMPPTGILPPSVRN